MKFSSCVILLSFILTANICMAQKQVKLPYVQTIKDAEKQGITVDHLDSIYKSAIHSDSTQAVFISDSDQNRLVNAYSDFMQGLGDFLDKHQYKWDKQTRIWNRLYFAPDGTVEYYLFIPKTEMSDEKIEKYKQLFTEYIKTHKIGITAPVRFAQCSPIIFKDK